MRGGGACGNKHLGLQDPHWLQDMVELSRAGESPGLDFSWVLRPLVRNLTEIKLCMRVGPQINFLAVFCHHTKASSLPIRTLSYDFLPSCTSARMSCSRPGESILVHSLGLVVSYKTHQKNEKKRSLRSGPASSLEGSYTTIKRLICYCPLQKFP